MTCNICNTPLPDPALRVCRACAESHKPADCLLCGGVIWFDADESWHSIAGISVIWTHATDEKGRIHMPF